MAFTGQKLTTSIEIIMLVATIISVYSGDSPQLFDRALKSIINQRLSDTVASRIYLAVDGDVSDEIESVIEQHLVDLHKVVRIIKNGGLANALNMLIEALEDEELIFRMDSDDVSNPIRYQLQIDYLATNIDVDIIGSDIIEFDETLGTRRLVKFYRPPGDVREYLCRGVPVAHPSTCMRRTVFKIAGLYPTTGTNEDIALWFNCAKVGLRFDNIPFPLLEFTVNRNFWDRRGFNKSFGELTCYLTGIYSLHGLTWRFAFPVARFFLRLAPRALVKLAYKLRSSAIPP